MNRKIDKIIAEHFKNSRQALLLTGARQVGKTYAFRKYAQKNKLQLIEMNFLLQPDTKNIVHGAKDIKDLLLRISAYSMQSLIPQKTILFFDEIQECPDILTWVKAIVDNGTYICALSGSLFGVELNDIRSIPVGYMTERTMYPLDFEEFIRALGVTDEVIDKLHESWITHQEVDFYIHKRMLDLYNLYLIVGGMPAVVQKYLDTNDLQRVLAEQQAILNLYKRDIAKYDKNNKLYINDIFDLIPSELNSKNKRFILKNLNENIKYSRFQNSFIWLRDADMALPVYNAEEPKVPLKLNEQRSLFKLFQNDVGLLASQYVQGIQLQILQGNVDINFGAIYENAVAQELHSHGWNLYYFNSKHQGEVDFLIEQGDQIIPIEVKSGKDYQRHVALNNLLNNDNYNINQAVVLCNGNVKKMDKIIYAPIYMTMFINYRQPTESIIFHPQIPVL